MTYDDEARDEAGAARDFRTLLHSLRVWDGIDLPHFAPEAAPATPLPLFRAWLREAAEAGQPEAHVMTLATADADGRPSTRVLTLHDADEDGWHFGTHSTSRKGRELAARPDAALGFYWPVQARQVRVEGQVLSGTPEAATADLHARSTGALAAALTGRMSDVLPSQAELREASEASWTRAEADPTLTAPTWTLYALAPTAVEFFQGDARRQHVRLRYRRDGERWVRELLWP
ncbi:pyridoxal 5'-phosphate synthase [Streptomyces sp. NBC_00237]|uniref:pyridoxine/pyridoxamine 5'-phosphate oxidase n=1 Tax=Streptomyces sp. NBC_00237 TaxID=2975687 RepID=UPI00224EC848|nr:pyridoxal 5'-phosphate synthase [Streptomyces sp. NBC_00237]MCX5200557.1 pyridoxal 5'-phosphate synthase [Streptomyces sp. NBC_00237]